MYSLPAYDKDCIDKSGNKIALSGGSECFGREVCRGGGGGGDKEGEGEDRQTWFWNVS